MMYPPLVVVSWSCPSIALALGEVTTHGVLNDAAGYICITTRTHTGNYASSQNWRGKADATTSWGTRGERIAPLLASHSILVVLKLFVTGDCQNTVKIADRSIDALLRVANHQYISR